MQAPHGSARHAEIPRSSQQHQCREGPCRSSQRRRYGGAFFFLRDPPPLIPVPSLTPYPPIPTTPNCMVERSSYFHPRCSQGGGSSNPKKEKRQEDPHDASAEVKSLLPPLRHGIIK